MLGVLSMVKIVGVQIVLHLLLAYMNNQMPSNKEIFDKLSTAECILQRQWDHKRAEHFNFGNDPRYDAPEQRDGQQFVLQGPHQRIARAIQVMSPCRRYELLQAMIQHGWVPGRMWDQPALPKETSCLLEKAYARLSNVRSGARMEVNNLYALSAHEGFAGMPDLTAVESLIYRPNAPPGDSGYRELTNLQPGVNEITIYLSNVRIPSAPLNLGTTPGPVSVTAEIHKNGSTSWPGGLGWYIRPYSPPQVGFARLQTGWLGIGVVCPDTPHPHGHPPPAWYLEMKALHEGPMPTGLPSAPQAPPGLPPAPQAPPGSPFPQESDRK